MLENSTLFSEAVLPVELQFSYLYGVLLALVGSSFQAFGLGLWKLHSTWKSSQTAAIDKNTPAVAELDDSLPDNVALQKYATTTYDVSNKSTPLAQHAEKIPLLNNNSPMCSQCPEICSCFHRKSCIHNTYQSSCIWCVGFCLFALGNVCDFIALGIAPLSVVTMVGSWTLVINTLVANCLLHEVVLPYDILSDLLIITGIILTVIRLTIL